MKKYLLFITMLASLYSSAQTPIEHTRENRVLTDRATQALYYLGVPTGPTPTFPSYVPDALKCNALYIATGVNPLYPAGIYYYNCATNTWAHGESYSAGTGLSLSTGNVFSVNYSQLDTRYAKLAGGNNFSGQQNFTDTHHTGQSLYETGSEIDYRSSSYASGRWKILMNNSDLLLYKVGWTGGAGLLTDVQYLLGSDGLRRNGIKLLETGEVYTKTHIDSAIANASTQVLAVTPTSGTSITNTALINATILNVSRSGVNYFPTGSSSPTGSNYYQNPTTGNVSFSDAFNSSGEPVLVLYKTVNVATNAGSVPMLTYATMAAIAYPTPQCFIVVNANEDQDGLRWIFYSPAGTTGKTQLQAIASTPNIF